MVAAHRRQIEHGVEGRHFENLDFRHVQQFRRGDDGGAGQPAAMGALREVEDRYHRAPLPPLRITGDDAPRLREGLIVEGEMRGLQRVGGERALQRSISPNTMSSVAMQATRSAS